VTDGPKRRARFLMTLCVITLGGSMIAAPTSAQPDIGTVQSRVDRLYHQAENASESYNNARLELRQAQSRQAAISAQLRRQQAKVNAVRARVAADVVAQYQGQALSSTAQVLLADSPDAVIDRLTTVSAYNDQQTQMMADFAVQAKRLETRRTASARELARIAGTKRRLGEEKAQVDKAAAEAKQLLGTLKDRAAARASRAQDRAAAAAAATSSSGATATDRGPAPASTPAPAPAPASASAAAPASGRAAAAVRYAMSKVGDAYVYGAAGPSAFDCSGLTMMAWAQAGVGLPHSASAQMGSGTPVSQSQLRPGDLVFYYSPVSHVGMYIGNGQIVNAENPSVGVKITGVNTMPYAGAVRPG
jgi:peptidoglycan DL-endopeptidase CwlO